MTLTREEGVAKMTAFARRQPLATLAASLELLGGLRKLDDAGRLTRAVLMDVICERCPAAEAAFAAWADSDDLESPVALIVTAAKAARS